MQHVLAWSFSPITKNKDGVTPTWVRGHRCPLVFSGGPDPDLGRFHQVERRGSWRWSSLCSSCLHWDWYRGQTKPKWKLEKVEAEGHKTRTCWQQTQAGPRRTLVPQWSLSCEFLCLQILTERHTLPKVCRGEEIVVPMPDSSADEVARGHRRACSLEVSPQTLHPELVHHEITASSVEVLCTSPCSKINFLCSPLSSQIKIAAYSLAHICFLEKFLSVFNPFGIFSLGGTLISPLP